MEQFAGMGNVICGNVIKRCQIADRNVKAPGDRIKCVAALRDGIAVFHLCRRIGGNAILRIPAASAGAKAEEENKR
jgi:hypothetical protein